MSLIFFGVVLSYCVHKSLRMEPTFLVPDVFIVFFAMIVPVFVCRVGYNEWKKISMKVG